MRKLLPVIILVVIAIAVYFLFFNKKKETTSTTGNSIESEKIEAKRHSASLWHQH